MKRWFAICDDIIRLVLEDYDDPQDTNALIHFRYNMGLVCRQWHQVSISYLYKNIHLSKANQPSALLRTVKHKPEQLRFIRTLSIQYQDMPYLYDCYALLAMCTNLRGLYLGAEQIGNHVPTTGLFSLYIKYNIDLQIAYCAAEQCGKSIREFSLSEDPREVLVEQRADRQAELAWHDECQEFDWNKLWNSMPNLETLELVIGDFIPYPDEIPETVTNLRIDTFKDILDGSQDFIRILPPSVTAIQVDWNNDVWPPTFPSRWLRPSSPSSPSHTIIYHVQYCLIQHYEGSLLRLMRSSLEHYHGGGTFNLQITIHPSITLDSNFLRAFRRNLKRILTACRPHFDSTDIFVKVGDDPDYRQVIIDDDRCRTCMKTTTDLAADGQRLKKCAACFSAYYCSRECQLANWGEHRVRCREIVEAGGAGAGEMTTWTDVTSSATVVHL